MQFIQQLVDNKYSIFNVDMKKLPVMKNGYGFKGWINKSYDELVEQHNYKNNKWGLRLGEHENGRCVLSLDFDIYDKSSNGDCIETKILLDEYLHGVSNHKAVLMFWLIIQIVKSSKTLFHHLEEINLPNTV